MKNQSPISGTASVPTRTRLNRSIANLIITTAIATGSLGLVSTMPASKAQAFGLGDIKKATKKVGGGIKKGAKKVGNKAGYVAKHGGKIAGGFVKDAAIGVKKANDVINYVPNAIQKGVRDTTLDAAGKAYGKFGSTLTNTYGDIRGINDENYQRSTQGAARQSRDFISGFGKRIDGYVGTAKRKAGKVLTKGITSGESLPRTGSTQRASRKLPKAAKVLRRQTRKAGKATSNGFNNSAGTMKPGITKGGHFLDKRARVPLKGISRKTIARRSSGQKFSTGVVQDGFFHGVNGSRPINGKQPRKVQGITKENLKPGKRHSRREMIGRDKSVFGRPLYRKDRRKVQGIRLKDIRKSRKQSRRKMIGRDKSVFGRPVFVKKQRNSKAPKKRLQNKRRGGSRKTVVKRNKRFDSGKRRSSSRRSVDRKSAFQKQARSNRGRFGNKVLKTSNRKGARGKFNRGRRR